MLIATFLSITTATPVLFPLYFFRRKRQHWETRKIAALNKENCEENPRSNLAQKSDFLRSQVDYINQVSEEIEGRVTTKLSQDFSRTESRILDALSHLHDFLLKPLFQGHSGTAPETLQRRPGKH